MCTAYEIGKRQGSFPEWLLAEVFEYLNGLDVPRIVRPTHRAPVILPDGSMREMTWGFRRKVPAVKTMTRWQTIVNSREDKLDTRTWNTAFRERRCLIPAAGFYEWVQGAGGMVPLRFTDPGEGMLWIAGIWEEDPERGEVYSMITTEPNALVGPVHDRMPAVLVPGQMRPFLDGELQEFGPSSVGLVFSEAENFLAVKKPVAPPAQGELF